MLDRNLLEKFELVEIKTSSRAKGFVTINKDKRILSISSKYTEQLPWINGERLNLKRLGETFILVPEKTGLLTLHQNKASTQIASANMCLEIMSKTHGCRKFEAWVEEDVLFFKPWKGEE